MKVKKYVAEDYQAAFQQAKKEMGREAVILNSRQVRKKGLLGFLFKPQVEITVAVDEELRIEMDKLHKPYPLQTNPQLLLPHEGEKSGEHSGAILEEIGLMKELMVDIKCKMYDVDLVKGMLEPVQEIYKALIDNQVNKEVALKIADCVESRLPAGMRNDYKWVKELSLRTLQEYLTEIKPVEISNKQKGKVVVMVGPTGVGKTTTIAKLAANLTFIDTRQVALITLDTYRVSAAEQLRTFAEIIDIPLRVVFDPSDLEEAINSFLDRDLIFIDTAGRSPYNQEQMEELREFLQAAHPDETILVMSVTTDSEDLVNIYKCFEVVGIDKIIFTKLDESKAYGRILNVLNSVRKPVAYFTNGQNVPDDIEVPDPLVFAQMVLRKDELDERSGQ